jgi:hypothetical protein
MERRLNERHPANLEVTVTDIEAQNRVASGKIVDISPAGVCAELSLGLAAGALVKVETGDCVLFGHVAYCTEGQSFRTGIEVVRVLIGQSDLARLVNAILAESMPATPGIKKAPVEPH